jgi:hypothetical protein
MTTSFQLERKCGPISFTLPLIIEMSVSSQECERSCIWHMFQRHRFWLFIYDFPIWFLNCSDGFVLLIFLDSRTISPYFQLRYLFSYWNMTFVSYNNNTTDATSGSGTAKHSRTPDCSPPVFRGVRVAQSIEYNVC